ncbi:MAG: nitrous oxide reductase family maturation protein NosD [Candidatus Heimdallarchaeota archaeon]
MFHNRFSEYLMIIIIGVNSFILAMDLAIYGNVLALNQSNNNTQSVNSPFSEKVKRRAVIGDTYRYLSDLVSMRRRIGETGKSWSIRDDFSTANDAEQFLSDFSPNFMKINAGPYLPHAPIYITNDAGFTNPANNFTGKGTEADPYTLTGFNFTDNTGTLIHIQNTTAHFEIYDNILNGIDKSNTGIFLSEVINGTILLNFVQNANYGIYLQKTNGSYLLNNSIVESLYNGIFLADSPLNTIGGNDVIANSAHGISVTASSYTSIFENDVLNNSLHGISGFNSSFLTLKDNYVENNKGNGIVLMRSANSVLSNNKIMSNGQNGLGVGYINDSYIDSNIIAYNSENGITVGISTNNLEIVYNDVFDNHGWAGIELGLSNGSKVSDNLVYNHDLGNGITLGYFGMPPTDTYFEIHYNSIYNNRYRGIRVEFSSSNMISYNDVHDNMEDGIDLYNASKNVIEFNSFYRNTWTGILLINSSHNNISDNFVESNLAQGIFLENSNDNLVYFNTIYDNFLDGIALVNSHYNFIDDNDVSWNGHGGSGSAISPATRSSTKQALRGSGIFLDPSNYNTIVNNYVTNNGENGIYLFDSDVTQIANNIVSDNLNGVFLQESAYNNISENYIFDNGQEKQGTVPADLDTSFAINQALRGSGIFLDPSDYNNIFGNHVFGNTGHGIYLIDSTEITVSDNVVSVNGLYGIYLARTLTTSTITFNDFGENNLLNPNAGSQAFDDGDGNVFDMNYWSDLQEGQTSYGIDGLSGNSDNNPSFVPLHFPEIELYPPVVQYPNGGETLSDIVSVQWKMSYAETITYWVFYSDDAGINWQFILTGLAGQVIFPGTVTDFSIEWDTKSVGNGDEYLIKVLVMNSEGFLTRDLSDGVFSINNTESNVGTRTTTTTTQPRISPGWSIGILLFTMVVTIAILRNKYNSRRL